MRKEIKRNYILKQPILGIFVGILLGQGSMLIQGNKPYLAVVYRQKKEGIQLISLLKSILSSFIDESKELGLKGHHGMLDKTHCFMTIKHICFKLLFDMFFFIKADQIVVSKKYKVKVSVDKSRYFSVGDYKKTVYSLKKKVPDNLYEYFDANVLAYWFMDELSCYYDDGLGLRGYLLDTSSFSEINSINKLVECLEVNLCLDSKVLSSKLKGINYILVKNIKDFNYKVYPYLLPEFYKKLYINNYSYENYVSFHKCVYKATSMNMTQFNLVIATILSGNTKLKSKNNKYYLWFELPETEKKLIYQHYLIMLNSVSIWPQKNKKRKSIMFKTLSHRIMFKCIKVLFSDNIFNVKMLSKYFNRSLLVFWYKSDGCIQRCSIYGDIRVYFRNTSNISSKGLTELQHIVYKTTDIILKKVWYSKTKQFLVVSEESYSRFLEYIRIFG